MRQPHNHPRILFLQAGREINRVVIECEPEKTGIDLNLIEQTSPVTWENVTLYGEYILNHDLVKVLLRIFLPTNVRDPNKHPVMVAEHSCAEWVRLSSRLHRTDPNSYLEFKPWN